jgi:hypothetical protein
VDDELPLPPLMRTSSAPAALASTLLTVAPAPAPQPTNPFLSLKVDAPEFSFKPAAAEFVPSFLSSAPAFVPSFAATPAASAAASKVFVDRSIPAVLLRRVACKTCYPVDFVWGLRQTVASVTLDNLDTICLRAPGPAPGPVQRPKAEKPSALSIDVDSSDAPGSSNSNPTPKSLKKRGQEIPGFIPPSRYGGAPVPTTPVPNSGRKSKGSDLCVDPSFVPPSRYGGCANPNAYKLKNLHVDTDVDAALVSTPTTHCDVCTCSCAMLLPAVTFPEKLRHAHTSLHDGSGARVVHVPPAAALNDGRAACEKYGKEKTHAVPVSATLRMLVCTWCAVGLLMRARCHRLLESCPAHLSLTPSVLLSSPWSFAPPCARNAACESSRVTAVTRLGASTHMLHRAT